MKVLPCVDLEAWLICFVGNTIADSGTKHHLGALHEVVHHVFKSWLKRLLIDEIEINFLIGCDLYSHVSANEIDLTSHLLELVILLPVACFFINFEKED